MYYISKRMEIAASHQLNLSYPSACENLHGHNWIIVVFCKGESLNQDGMLIDFVDIKKNIHGILDHAYINDIVDFNPTAENLAKWIVDRIDNCYKASVEESESNIAIYEEDNF